MHVNMKRFAMALAGLLALASTAGVQAAERLMPFILGDKATTGSVESVTAEVKTKLTNGGYIVAGEFSPYENAHIVVVTNDRLKQHAAQSEWGGYGAVQRVAVTRLNDEIQVSYTNPEYMAHAYRMKEGLSDVKASLAGILGEQEHFGAKKGLKPNKLRKYHYMFGMEYFDEPSVLAKYPSHDAAVKAVEANLAKGVAGITKVYRVDIPGKQETVFGVARKAPSEDQKYMDDAYIMNEIDFKDLRSTAHLPYEMMVSGDTVYALYARFRIAMSFPNLSMMGKNSFMNIMETPKTLEKALMRAAGGDLKQFNPNE